MRASWILLTSTTMYVPIFYPSKFNLRAYARKLNFVRAHSLALLYRVQPETLSGAPERSDFPRGGSGGGAPPTNTMKSDIDLKSEIFEKEWDLSHKFNIRRGTHDGLLKVSMWPRVEKHVLSTPRASRYDFYGQFDQNLWPSWWKSGKNMKLCQNELQKNYFWLLRSSPGSDFHFKSI